MYSQRWDLIHRLAPRRAKAPLHRWKLVAFGSSSSCCCYYCYSCSRQRKACYKYAGYSHVAFRLCTGSLCVIVVAMAQPRLRISMKMDGKLVLEVSLLACNDRDALFTGSLLDDLSLRASSKTRHNKSSHKDAFS